MAKIAITWKRSAIGFPEDQRRTIAGLGLRRLHQTVVHDDNPAIGGMVRKVRHLVETSEPPAEPPAVKKAPAKKTPAKRAPAKRAAAKKPRAKKAS